MKCKSCGVAKTLWWSFCKEAAEEEKSSYCFSCARRFHLGGWRFAEHPYLVKHILLGEKSFKTYREAWEHFCYLNSYAGIDRSYIHLFQKTISETGVAVEEGPIYWSNPK